MQHQENGYLFSDDKNAISLDRVCQLLSKTYWANARSRETIEASVKNSLCYGIYRNSVQVGFARVVTDHATMYWLCDVIIDDGHREKGLGKKLIELIVHSDELKGLRGILATKDAHGLYEQQGFMKDGDRFMVRAKW